VRRAPALLLAFVLLSAAPPAYAHVPARVRLAAPAQDARVVGTALRIVLVGEDGTSAATFMLDLDGQAVGADGTLGGLFTTLHVRPQTQETITVDGLTPGEHVLRMTPDPDTDSTAPVVMRTFRVVADDPGGGGGLALLLVGVLAAVAIGAAVAVRRRAAVAGRVPS
jgi:hypothetical protein